MLPEERRLADDHDFRQVQRRGGSIATPSFALFSLKAPLLRPTRFGFVISTKVDKRATVRNRIKRLFREGVRYFLPKIQEGFDVVFFVRRHALEMKAEELRSEIGKALGKAGILK